MHTSHLPTTLLSILSLWLSFPSATTPYSPLSDSFLRAIPTPNDSTFSISPTTATSLLSPLLIPRVPGTPGQVAAQTHLSTFFTTHLPTWTLTWSNSTSTTPATGSRQIPFANLIARRTPPWTQPGEPNYLTLVAHYDSKRTPAGFIGATDSAAPCAILLWTATILEPFLAQMYAEMAALDEGGTLAMDMGVQLLFLDGEEAAVTWSDTDSLYGSRALARAWDAQANPLPRHKFYKYKSPLEQISLFVLLDLLGSQDPAVPSYMPTTHWAYRSLAAVEARLRSLDLLETHPAKPFLTDAKADNATAKLAAVSDDHLPFLHKGVETLHLIPSPFPDVWHTSDDDGAHLDLATVRDWAKIVVGFASEWLDLMEVWTEPGEEEEEEQKQDDGKRRKRRRRRAL